MLTANAWVDSGGGATITFWSEDGWTDGSWSVEATSMDFPDADYTSLYNPWNYSGMGTIDGNYLIIYIAPCPEGYFSVTVEKGTKIFMLSEGNITFGAALIGVNNAPIETYEAETHLLENTMPKSLVYFGGDLSPFKGRLRGQLQKNGQLHAVVGGNAVDSVHGNGYWAVPAAIFTDFFWHIVPTERTVYDFVFQEQKRSGGGRTISIPVEMDLHAIYSPLPNSAYPVSPNDTFYISQTTGLEVNYDKE